MLKVILLGVVSLGAGFFAIALSNPSPCDDHVRGFEQSAQASLSFVKDELSRIDGSMSGEKTRKFLQTVEFSAAEYGAIQFCLVDCRFLSDCAKWQFWKAPSEACPREYENYQLRVTEANQLLERLANAEQGAREAVVAAEKLQDAKAKLDSALLRYRSRPNDASLARLDLKRMEANFENILDTLSNDLNPGL